MTDNPRPLDVGDSIPDITLTDIDGNDVRLTDLLGDRPAVVFFYPKDGSPVCTAEACAFRDAYEEFAEAGAQVVGISGDSPERHRRFADRHGLNFRLLSDPEGKARQAFGVAKTMGVMPGRVTYVIDRGGAIRHVFRSQLSAGRHVKEALAGLKELD